MTGPDDAELATLAARVADRLSRSGLRLATAESCTGGWIAKVCTDLPGSSRWFVGGTVAYADDVKQSALGVDATVLGHHGAVSEPVARAMAVGVLTRTGADVGVAVSGIAGPDGGSPGKPVGTVWLAWARRMAGGEPAVVTALETFSGNRESVRRLAVQRALMGLVDP
jgi:nicotinamide-nucleotide amidase